VIWVNVAALTEGVLKTMLMTKLKIITAAVLLIVAIGVGAWGVGLSIATARTPETQLTDQPTPPKAKEAALDLRKADVWASSLLTEKFAETQKLIKPQLGESRWMEIPWQTSLWEARQLAAKEGKPMFVWSGSGGAPCAPT